MVEVPADARGTFLAGQTAGENSSTVVKRNGGREEEGGCRDQKQKHIKLTIQYQG